MREDQESNLEGKCMHFIYCTTLIADQLLRLSEFTDSSDEEKTPGKRKRGD